MKASGIKHDGRAEKTAPAVAVDVLGVVGVREVRETDTPRPDPDPGPPPPPLRGDPLLDPGPEKVIFERKAFLSLFEFYANNTLFKV